MSQLSNRIERIHSIVKLPESAKSDMLAKFSILADEIVKGSSSQLIMQNIDTYNLLCTREVMYALRYDKQMGYFVSALSNNPKLSKVLGSADAIESILKLVNPLLTSNQKDTVNAETIITALNAFGVKMANPDDMTDESDILGSDILDEDLDELFDDENLQGNLFDEEDISSEDTTNDSQTIDKDDDIPIDQDEEYIENPEESMVSEDDEVNLKDDRAEENLTSDGLGGDENTFDKDFAEVWTDIIQSNAIAGLLSSFRVMYESCYSGITAPDGILTPDGVLSFEKPIDGRTNADNVSADAKNRASSHGNRREFILNHGKLNQRKSYTSMYKAIMYAYGVAYGRANELTNTSVENQKSVVNEAVRQGEKIFGPVIDGRKDTIPKWVDIANQNFMYPRLHEEFMTGYFAMARDMKQWASENKAHHSADKITSYDSMEKWIKKKLTDCILQACKDYKGPNGETITIDSDTVEILPICQKVVNSVKNIIAITANKKGYKTIKICSNVPNVDDNLIANKVQSYLNWSTAGSSATTVIAKGNSSDVIELDIVESMKDYNASSSFASSVIDDILTSGQIPRWDNALLGEKNEGGAFTYNFKNKGSISIYGASGSGKGIMTSALLSNGLIDNCFLFYFDGKPDNGAALGKVAWDNGLEAPVFNGLQGGSNTFPEHLEAYSHGIRDITWRDMCKKFIPEIDNSNEIGMPAWPFNDEISQKLLLEVSYTLIAFQFVHDMILLRTRPEFVQDRWAIFVIDEIQDAAMNEKQLREKFKEYMDAAGEREVYKTESKTDSKGNVTTAEKRDGKIKDRKNWAKDTGYLFCQRWLSWADNCCSQWDNIVTKSLRNSSSTLITIFQSNAWLTQDDKGAGKTKIGRLMLKVAAKTTKIVGKGALVSANQWGDERDYPWTRETSKGKWVISNGESGLSPNDQIFRPFKCFTTDLGPDMAVPLDDRGAGAENCKKSRYDNGNDPVGLQSYLIYLFTGMQDEIQRQIADGKRLPGSETPQDVLNSSFQYFDSILKTPNKMYANDPEGLLHYMYTIPCLANANGVDLDDSVDGEDYIDGDTPESTMDTNTNIYNQGIFDDFEEDEDDEELNFGTPINTSDASSVNTENRDTQPQNVRGLGEYAEGFESFDSSTVLNSGLFQNMNNFYDEDDDEEIDFGNMNDQQPTQEEYNVSFEDAEPNPTQTFSTEETNGEGTEEYTREYEVNTDQSDVDYSKLYDEAFFKPEQMPINNEQTAQTFGKRGRNFRLNPSDTSSSWQLTDDNCIIARMPSYDTSERYSNRFFRTIKGTQWEFDRRWNIILKSIAARVKSKDLINRVQILEDSITVNGRYVALDGVTGGFEDIQFKDLVNIKMLAKKFRNISDLTLDKVIYNQVLIEIGDAEPVEYLFNLMPRLQELKLVNMTPDGQGMKIDRATFRDMNNQRKAQQLREQESYKRQMQAMASSLDPRFNERNPGQQMESVKSSGQFMGDARAVARNQFRRSSRSFVGGTAHSLVTIGAIAVGGVFGAVAGAWHWLNKRK